MAAEFNTLIGDYLEKLQGVPNPTREGAIAGQLIRDFANSIIGSGLLKPSLDAYGEKSFEEPSLDDQGGNLSAAAAEFKDKPDVAIGDLDSQTLGEMDRFIKTHLYPGYEALSKSLKHYFQPFIHDNTTPSDIKGLIGGYVRYSGIDRNQSRVGTFTRAVRMLELHNVRYPDILKGTMSVTNLGCIKLAFHNHPFGAVIEDLCLIRDMGNTTLALFLSATRLYFGPESSDVVEFPNQ